MVLGPLGRRQRIEASLSSRLKRSVVLPAADRVKLALLTFTAGSNGWCALDWEN
jgi:hypothetical protein